MSNKNLKVYKIQFLTEVKTLHLNVKFPCDIKMTWKRSNESAQTQKIKLVDGKAVFNQTLKLTVNMYFDTTTNKFVQKKCIYSFLIFTQKGQKSAGSITYDLADFFNKRVYDVQQSFVLQKCPVKDTKCDMKIYYEESVETGYDSMSQISTTSQLDISTNNPLDLSELNQSKETHSQKSNSTVQGTTKSSEPIRSKQQTKTTTLTDNYGSLNQSDVESQQYKSRKVICNRPIDLQFSNSNKQNKIGQNIKGIQQVTYKLNDFASKFKSNLSYDLQQKKRKINQLSEQMQSVNQLNKKLQAQLKQQRNQKQQIEVALSALKTNSTEGEKQKLKKLEQLERKLQQQKKARQSLQQQLTNASSNEQSSGRYMKELKQQFKKEQELLKLEVQKVSKQLIQQKRQKSEYQAKYKKVNEQYQELNQKYDRLLNKYQNMQGEIRKRQGEIEVTRMNLDIAVQNLMDSLSSVL